MTKRLQTTRNSTNAGFTLLEVIIAVAITSLLAALVMSVFLSASKTQQATHAVVSNHETARTLTQTLNQDLSNTRVTSISAGNQISKPAGVTYGGVLQTPTGNITYRLNNDNQLTRTDQSGNTRIVAGGLESILFNANHATQLIHVHISMRDSPFTFTVTKRVTNQ